MARSTFLCSAGIVAPNRSRYSAPYRRTTSATVGMAQGPINASIRATACSWLDRGQMEVDHRRLQRTVAEVLLDQPQVDAGFEQVGGVAMS